MSRGIGAIQAGQAFIQLSLNDKEFRKNLHGARTYMNQWASTLTKVGATMSLAGGGMLAAFGLVTKQIANLESAFRRFDLMFGDLGGGMEAELAKIAKATSIPMSTLKEHAAMFGSTFAEMKDELTDDQYLKVVAGAVEQVTNLVGLAGISFEEAAQRIQSGFTSTGESLDQFGYNLRKANMEAEAQRLGMEGSILTMTEQQKQLIKLSLMQRQTARTGITFASTAKTINAQLTLMGANIREIMSRMIGFMNKVLVPVLRTLNVLLYLARPLGTVFAPLLTLLGVLGAGTLATGGIILFTGLLAQMFSIAIGGWLKVTRLVKDFDKAYIITKAALAATGALDLATAAWGRLAAAIAWATTAIKGFTIAGALAGLQKLLNGLSLILSFGLARVMGTITTLMKAIPGLLAMLGRLALLHPGIGAGILGAAGVAGLGHRIGWFPPKQIPGNPTEQSVLVKHKEFGEAWFTPNAQEVSRRANRMPVAVAGGFGGNVAQRFAFATSASGVDQTNSLLGGLQGIIEKVITPDKQVRVTGNTAIVTQ